MNNQMPLSSEDFYKKADEELLGGGDEYTSYLATKFILNLVHLTDVASPFAYKICSALESGPANIFIDGLENFPIKKSKKGEPEYPYKIKPARNSVDKRDWEALKIFLENKASEFEQERITPSVPHQNLDKVSSYLGLTKLQRDILGLAYTSGSIYEFRVFIEPVIDHDLGKMPAIIARMLCQPHSMEIEQELKQKSVLRNSGIISLQRDEADEFDFDVAINLREQLSLANLEEDDFVNLVVGKPSVSELTCDDFPFLSDDIQRIKRIISAAIERGEKGINILLHGPPGSGKTVLARALAHDLDLKLYAVGEEDDFAFEEDEGPSRSASKQRTTQLLQAHAFLGHSKGALLLFDEIEDLLLKTEDSSKKADTFSKIIVNRLLEENPVVTIWTGNDPDKFHESVRQRFAYSLYVDYPPILIREKIIERQLRLQATSMPAHEIRQIARDFMAPPRLLSNAIRVCRSNDNIDANELERVMLASSRLTYGSEDAIRSQAGVSRLFRPELFNIDPAYANELSALTAPQAGVKPYTVFFQGPAGAGMSSMARYIAEQSVLNQHEHDIRTLLVPSAFSSPAMNLRQAFADAMNAKAILVFSHLDGFVEADSPSDKEWTTSLAPYFLKLAYDHQLPIIAHSYKSEFKFPGMMQSAFGLRAKVSSLTQEQAHQAFHVYFGRETKESLPDGLTPSDFSNVRKIINKGLNGQTLDSQIIELLIEQRSFRKQPASSMGFNIQRA